MLARNVKTPNGNGRPSVHFLLLRISPTHSTVHTRRVFILGSSWGTGQAHSEVEYSSVEGSAVVRNRAGETR